MKKLEIYFAFNFFVARNVGGVTQTTLSDQKLPSSYQLLGSMGQTQYSELNPILPPSPSRALFEGKLRHCHFERCR